MSVLTVQDLCKSYEKAGASIPVLRGVSFEVAPGESLAVVGVSGIGKSTLLHCCGLLDELDSGKIEIEGRDLQKLSRTERAKTRQEKIGFVFQFHYLMTELTAVENVMLPLMIGRRSSSDAKKKAEDWLSQVGLSHRLQHLPGQLSGGEQQRVALARALVAEPKLILADEPTGNLDPETGELIFELLIKRAQELEAGLVMATHNLELAGRMNRQLRLHEGRMS